MLQNKVHKITRRLRGYFSAAHVRAMFIAHPATAQPQSEVSNLARELIGSLQCTQMHAADIVYRDEARTDAEQYFIYVCNVWFSESIYLQNIAAPRIAALHLIRNPGQRINKCIWNVDCVFKWTNHNRRHVSSDRRLSAVENWPRSVKSTKS